MNVSLVQVTERALRRRKGTKEDDDKQELVMGYIVHNLTDAGEE